LFLSLLFLLIPSLLNRPNRQLRTIVQIAHGKRIAADRPSIPNALN
jgi:hypothetical protein